MNSKRAQELIDSAKLTIDSQKNGAVKSYGRWRNVVASIMLPDELTFVMSIVKKEKDALDVVLVNIARGFRYDTEGEDFNE